MSVGMSGSGRFVAGLSGSVCEEANRTQTSDATRSSDLIEEAFIMTCSYYRRDKTRPVLRFLYVGRDLLMGIHARGEYAPSSSSVVLVCSVGMGGSAIAGLRADRRRSKGGRSGRASSNGAGTLGARRGPRRAGAATAEAGGDRCGFELKF